MVSQLYWKHFLKLSQNLELSDIQTIYDFHTCNFEKIQIYS